MKRLIILVIIALSILTSHSQILPPDIRKVAYPVIETNDSSLNSTIREAVRIICIEYPDYYFTKDSFRDIVVAFPDSIPSSGKFIATVYLAHDADIFLTFWKYYKNIPWPKEYYGISYEYYKDMSCRVYYSGDIAKDFYHLKGDEICSYEYDANVFLAGEDIKLAILYDHGVWSVVPNSLMWNSNSMQYSIP